MEFWRIFCLSENSSSGSLANDWTSENRRFRIWRLISIHAHQKTLEVELWRLISIFGSLCFFFINLAHGKTLIVELLRQISIIGWSGKFLSRFLDGKYRSLAHPKIFVIFFLRASSLSFCQIDQVGILRSCYFFHRFFIKKFLSQFQNDLKFFVDFEITDLGKYFDFSLFIQLYSRFLDVLWSTGSSSERTTSKWKSTSEYRCSAQPSRDYVSATSRR